MENKTKVGILTGVEETVFTSGQNNELFGKVTVRPLLNCFDQDDPYLVDIVRREILRPPSTLPYNFQHKLHKNLRETGADGQPRAIDNKYFRGAQKGGFFVEAGAFDGQTDSTSTYFEITHDWTGLLVEPMPLQYGELVRKNRRAWSIQTCLSTETRPQTVTFDMSGSSHDTMAGISVNSSESSSNSVRMQCLPLYTILLALGNPTIHFFSLDIEGAELQVLKTLPWDKIDIRAFSIETLFAGEVTSGNRTEIIEYLASKGYTHLGPIARDDLFGKLPPGGVTPAVTLREVMTKTTKRLCTYLLVPNKDLATHCMSNYPRDFFTPQDPHYMPECIKRTRCPWDIVSLAGTLKYSAPWPSQLSDSCIFVVI